MPTGPAAGDEGKIKGVRAYLQEHFPGYEVDHFPKGHKVAEVFRVVDRGRVVHQLYVSRKFMDRAADAASLIDALTVAGVVGRMRNVGATTIELY